MSRHNVICSRSRLNLVYGRNVMAGFSIVWLRNDLRCYDNAALHAALELGLPVVIVFVATPRTWSQHQMAPIKQDLLRRRVQVQVVDDTIQHDRTVHDIGEAHHRLAGDIRALCQRADSGRVRSCRNVQLCGGFVRRCLKNRPSERACTSQYRQRDDQNPVPVENSQVVAQFQAWTDR